MRKKNNGNWAWCLPRIGNGLVWTVSFVDGNILCDAVGDIALELGCGSAVSVRTRNNLLFCFYIFYVLYNGQWQWHSRVRLCVCISILDFSLSFNEHDVGWIVYRFMCIWTLYKAADFEFTRFTLIHLAAKIIFNHPWTVTNNHTDTKLLYFFASVQS